MQYDDSSQTETVGRHEVLISGDVARVYMTRMSFLIDVADLDLVTRTRWSFHKGRSTNYAKHNDWATGACVLLHRFLMKPASGMVVDHINKDGLDCRRSNMRVSDFSQNGVNSEKCFGRGAKSIYKGVCKCARSGKWIAQYSDESKPVFLGRFDLEEDAARVRDAMMVRLHPEHAVLNFPDISDWAVEYLDNRGTRTFTSDCPGVYSETHHGKHRDTVRWRAYCKNSDGKRISLGSFATEGEAAEAVRYARMNL